VGELLMDATIGAMKHQITPPVPFTAMAFKVQSGNPSGRKTRRAWTLNRRSETTQNNMPFKAGTPTNTLDAMCYQPRPRCAATTRLPLATCQRRCAGEAHGGDYDRHTSLTCFYRHWLEFLGAYDRRVIVVHTVAAAHAQARQISDQIKFSSEIQIQLIMKKVSVN
jgi:hypothetical protein